MDTGKSRFYVVIALLISFFFLFGLVLGNVDNRNSESKENGVNDPIYSTTRLDEIFVDSELMIIDNFITFRVDPASPYLPQKSTMELFEKILNDPEKGWGATGIEFKYDKLSAKEDVDVVFYIAKDIAEFKNICGERESIGACAAFAQVPCQITLYDKMINSPSNAMILNHEMGHCMGLGHGLDGVMMKLDYRNKAFINLPIPRPSATEIIAVKEVARNQIASLGYDGARFVFSSLRNKYNYDRSVGVAVKDGQQFHIDRFGKPLYEQRYDRVAFFKDGAAQAYIKKNRETFCINLKGERLEGVEC